jgi:hypothetical protein
MITLIQRANYELVDALYHAYGTREYVTQLNKMFLDHQVYNGDHKYYYSVAAYHTRPLAEAMEASVEVMRLNKLDVSMVRANMCHFFYFEPLLGQMSKESLLDIVELASDNM